MIKFQNWRHSSTRSLGTT